MMVGVCGTSRTEKRYAYYLCNNSRKKLCDKKNVQKEFIENLVVEEARNILTDENIDKISKTVVQLAEKEKDDTRLKTLNKLLQENEKQKANLFNSLKICEIDSVRKSIFEEMVKVDEERTSIETEIQIENAKKLDLDEMQVKFFLKQIRSGNVNSLKYRKLLVNVLINKIYLYDDNVTIFFNTQDKEYSSKVPTIEEAEVRIKDKTAHQIVQIRTTTFM